MRAEVCGCVQKSQNKLENTFVQLDESCIYALRIALYIECFAIDCGKTKTTLKVIKTTNRNTGKYPKKLTTILNKKTKLTKLLLDLVLCDWWSW